MPKIELNVFSQEECDAIASTLLVQIRHVDWDLTSSSFGDESLENQKSGLVWGRHIAFKNNRFRAIVSPVELDASQWDFPQKDRLELTLGKNTYTLQSIPTVGAFIEVFAHLGTVWHTWRLERLKKEADIRACVLRQRIRGQYLELINALKGERKKRKPA